MNILTYNLKKLKANLGFIDSDDENELVKKQN